MPHLKNKLNSFFHWSKQKFIITNKTLDIKRCAFSITTKKYPKLKALLEILYGMYVIGSVNTVISEYETIINTRSLQSIFLIAIYIPFVITTLVQTFYTKIRYNVYMFICDICEIIAIASTTYIIFNNTLNETTIFRYISLGIIITLLSQNFWRLYAGIKNIKNFMLNVTVITLLSICCISINTEIVFLFIFLILVTMLAYVLPVFSKSDQNE